MYVHYQTSSKSKQIKIEERAESTEYIQEQRGQYVCCVEVGLGSGGIKHIHDVLQYLLNLLGLGINDQCSRHAAIDC